jgi:hypothetical protein
MRVRRVALAAGLSLLALAAVAAEGWVRIEQRLTPAQMHETGLDKLSADELKRLNEILANEDGAGRVDAAAVERRGDAERHGGDRGAAGYIGMDAERITTRIEGRVEGWEPGTEFHLANGQVWKVLKGSMKLRKPKENPEVVLVPGVMGRWFLQVDEDAPKARVYRTD